MASYDDYLAREVDKKYGGEMETYPQNLVGAIHVYDKDENFVHSILFDLEVEIEVIDEDEIDVTTVLSLKPSTHEDARYLKDYHIKERDILSELYLAYTIDEDYNMEDFVKKSRTIEPKKNLPLLGYDIVPKELYSF